MKVPIVRPFALVVEAARQIISDVCSTPSDHRSNVRHLLLMIAICTIAVGASAQITTTDLNTISAQDIGDLIAGKGAVVSNVTFTGAPEAAGVFSGGVAAGLGLESGVILSTGNIAGIQGPNDEPSHTSAFGNPGDGDLDALVDLSTYDASVLEFDVVVQNTFELVIHYVFASEEYREYVGSSFNDVFAFFVNGKNVAFVPGNESIPVSINTINHNDNSSLYRDNPEGAPIADTEFDGFTIPLTARAAVVPGVKTRVKIAIADTSDFILDSAVILATSGIAGGQASISFDASPPKIRRGEETTLVWTTTNANSVAINHGVGTQPTRGSVSVSPQETTTYTLTATGNTGSTTATVTVDVITEPQVVIAAQPDTLVQGTSEGGATQTFTIANVGGAATQVTLSKEGNFF
ncbi:MAG: choice-of-anchor L domain-containing protein, partial [Acidobacteria bacterium]|nr:choice-of-anchor L domain-containing protein [Acidobacteriota bacterium]